MGQEISTASLSLADVPGTVRLWRQRKAEFLLSITAFVGVALLGVLPGIAIAVALSILNVFRRGVALRHRTRPGGRTARLPRRAHITPTPSCGPPRECNRDTVPLQFIR
jgi:MFS superfamily sulfate permease-like transporter